MGFFKLFLSCVTLFISTVNADGDSITLDFISSVFVPGSYDAAGNAQYSLDSGALEQIAVDTSENLVYGVGDTFLHIIDISDIENMRIIHKAEFDGFEMTDIIICGRYVYITRDNKMDRLRGDVAVFEKYNRQTETMTGKTTIAVGALPDMLKASKNCSIIVVAVEGEPFVKGGNLVDPEGGVAIIRYHPLVDTFTTNRLNFEGFNTIASILMEAGVRKSNPNALFSADMEPEYVDFNEDYSKAYIALQENNAIAVVDLIREEIITIQPLGFKDWSMYQLDASDQDGGVHFQPWPIFGMYMPDAIHHVTSNGVGYIFTANEGDYREYDEEVDTAHGGYTDAIIGAKIASSGMRMGFPHTVIDEVNNVTQLGRLRFSTINGQTASRDGLDRLYAFGGRGFSIYRADTMEQVYDSGSDLEKAIKNKYSHLFNAEQSADETIAQTRDTRSDDKGPEAEGLEFADLFGKHLVFVGIEKPGLIAVYSYEKDITDIKMESIWSNIPNDKRRTWGELFDQRKMSAVEPEDMKFIPASESPNGKPLLLVAGNMCGSLSALEIDDD